MARIKTNISGVEVRRHNGQCAYGPWMPVYGDDVPTWVYDTIEDEIDQTDPDNGRVEQGGAIWIWRYMAD